MFLMNSYLLSFSFIVSTFAIILRSAFPTQDYIIILFSHNFFLLWFRFLNLRFLIRLEFILLLFWGETFFFNLLVRHF